MRFKLIALDLDGTLCDSTGNITAETRDALIGAEREGALIALASGRPEPGMRREAQLLEMERHHGLLVSYNGGRVRDVQTGEIVYEKPIPADTAKRLLRRLDDFDLNPIIDDGEAFYTRDPDSFRLHFEADGLGLKIVTVPDVSEYIGFSPVKILLAAPPEIMAAQKDAFSAPFLGELDFALSAPFYLEVTAKGVHKCSSLEYACGRLGIGMSEVIAFGDAENDLLMLRHSGCGVAMGNSCEALKAAADEVTLSNDEDGIAKTLKKYF